MPHILLVEDEVDAQDVVAALLDHYDMTLEVASTAEAALSMLEERPYAAAIIDLALPGMDGLMLLKTIRSAPATVNLPCLVMTAYYSSLVKKQAIEAGCNAFVPKPLEHAYFVQELERILK